MPNRLRRTNSLDYGEREHARISTIEADDDPITHDEAMSRKDANKWQEAMEEEIKALKKNQVSGLASLPQTANLVTCRWVYKIKRRPDGKIERYRARLVARGFSPIEGVDYNETFAPVVNTVVVRLMFAFASIMGLTFKQFDIKTAFLYGKLDEEVYMEQPPGFQDGSNKVRRLKRSLYGLKQAPRQWKLEFTDHLKQLGLEQSNVDKCVFYSLQRPRVFLIIYVDDGLIFSHPRKLQTRSCTDSKDASTSMKKTRVSS